MRRRLTAAEAAGFAYDASMPTQSPREPAPVTQWPKRREMVKRGYKDLVYLPRGRCEWNMTLAAVAYSVRRQIVEKPDLALWAVMHGLPVSRRYLELGARALVLWHGTSAARAEKIREVGLYPKKGIWATAEPKLAHSFSRHRGTTFAAGSAMFCLVFDREDIPVAFEPAREDQTLRFRQPIRPDFFEYVLYDDRIDFVGSAKARRPRPWGVGRFKRSRGRWITRSRPPVRMDDARSYGDLGEWLELSIVRIVQTLGSATAIEVFSSLYATIDPTDALPHATIFEALERLCPRTRFGRNGCRQFSLPT